MSLLSIADYEEAMEAIAILARQIGSLPGRRDKEEVEKLNLIIDIAEGSEIPDELIDEIHPDWAEDDE